MSILSQNKLNFNLLIEEKDGSAIKPKCWNKDSVNNLDYCIYLFDLYKLIYFSTRASISS